MKILLSLFLAWASYAASFNYVQSNSSAGANSTLAFTSNNTAGNTIIVMWAGFGNNGQPSSITDSNSNTYTTIGFCNPCGDNNAQAVYVYMATSIASGANTVTFHGIPGAASQNQIVAEYSVPSTYFVQIFPWSNWLDQTSIPTYWPDYSFGSPSFPSEVMLIVILYDALFEHTWVASHGTVRQSTNENGNRTAVLADYDVVSPSSQVTTALSATGGNSMDIIGYRLALFVPAAGGGGSPGGAAFVSKLHPPNPRKD